MTNNVTPSPELGRMGKTCSKCAKAHVLLPFPTGKLGALHRASLLLVFMAFKVRSIQPYEIDHCRQCCEKFEFGVTNSFSFNNGGAAVRSPLSPDKTNP